MGAIFVFVLLSPVIDKYFANKTVEQTVEQTTESTEYTQIENEWLENEQHQDD